MEKNEYDELNEKQIERLKYLKDNISVLEVLKDNYPDGIITEKEPNIYSLEYYHSGIGKKIRLVIDEILNIFSVYYLENGEEILKYKNLDIFTYFQTNVFYGDNLKVLSELEDFILKFRYRKQTLEDRQIIYKFFNKKGITKETIDKYHTYLEKNDNEEKIVIETTSEREIIYKVSLNDNSIEIPPDDELILKDEESYRLKLGLNYEYIYNSNTQDKNIYVCDNIFDALKIESFGKKAISLDGIEFLQDFFTYININNAFQFNYILYLKDNYEIKNYVEEFLNEKNNIKHNVVLNKIYIPKEFENINEWYENDRDVFEASLQPMSNNNMLLYLKNNFRQDIKESAEHCNLSTGFKNLDKAINGIRPTLYVLGAIPSLGKTTLMHQIADNLAKNGQNVLFFSLEQGKLELAAKSISRLTYTSKKHTKTPQNTIQVMQSTDSNRNVKEAIDEYEKFAHNICIIEGKYDTTIQNIKKYIEQYVQYTNKHPVIIIDYLQIISSIDEKQAERQNIDENVRILYELSHNYKLPIFVICSVSRAYYDKQMDMMAFKESGGIEYGADVLMGLQLQKVHELDGVGNKSEVLNYAKAEIPRKVELVVLKNKNGMFYNSCYFNYYAEYNYFEETEAFIKENTDIQNGRGFDLENKKDK